jgi:dodecin
VIPLKGRVEWVNTENGYGFITPKVGTRGIMFCASGMSASTFKRLEKGDEVTYEAIRAAKGEQAIDVYRSLFAWKPSAHGTSQVGENFGPTQTPIHPTS